MEDCHRIHMNDLILEDSYAQKVWWHQIGLLRFLNREKKRAVLAIGCLHVLLHRDPPDLAWTELGSHVLPNPRR